MWSDTRVARRVVRMGVIGGGFGRAVHLPGWLAASRVEVVGIATQRPEQARRIAADCSLSKSFDTWQQLVECPDIDAVSIATPPALHEPMALAALAAGKAVLCEKPLALDAAQAARMLAAARQAQVVHMVDFEFREHPVWQLVQQRLQAGALGPLRLVVVTWVLGSWADASRPWSWRADGAQGGGTLGAFGAHVFDYLEWLCGPVRSVAANLTTRVPRRPDAAGIPRPVESEDCCQLMAELEDGTPVHVVLSSVARFGRGHWIELYGDRGTLVAGSPREDYGTGFRIWEGSAESPALQEVAVPAAPPEKQAFPDGRIAPFIRLAQRFADAVLEGRLDARPSFEDGARAQLLMESALRAHQQRAWIDVPAPQQRTVA